MKKLVHDKEIVLYCLKDKQNNVFALPVHAIFHRINIEKVVANLKG